jgi:hypothetical protein
MKKFYLLYFYILLLFSNQFAFSQNYPIVETNITDFYSNTAIISAPSIGDGFYGQDATYSGNNPSYTDNGDGTITDNVTGLMWAQDMGDKITFDTMFTMVEASEFAGYDDWRVPTIKDLYSLILFTGQVGPYNTAVEMFIDTNYFNQPLGDTAIGEREIDAQTWSATQYVGVTFENNETVFGVNFVDGHIKGYPKSRNGADVMMYSRMVRNNVDYGKNDFVDNGDGTISDLATGLMWQKADDGSVRDWEESLEYAEGLDLANYSDWRLPNIKELHSIVDYTRSPQTTQSPAIDPLFETTEILDPDGNSGQYGYFWSGTTFLWGSNPSESAAYIAFGEGQGKMFGVLMDVHGAGCQRSDLKSGNIEDYPQYGGPQGDVKYVFNYVRCVRDISIGSSINNYDENIDIKIYPNPMNDNCFIQLDRIYSNVSISLANSLGKYLIRLNETNTDKLTLSTEELSHGCYFLVINTDGKQVTKKIIK